MLLFSTVALARTNLKDLMAGTCEKLGMNNGMDCVKLQRKLEKENVIMDNNGAGICSLIWQWGSQVQNPHSVGVLVLQCFKQVSNVKVSQEVRDTCGKRIDTMQGSSPSSELIQAEVKRAMNCIKQLAIPVGK